MADANWTVDHLHDVYKLIMSSPGEDYSQLAFWTQHFALHDLSSRLQQYSPSLLHQLWLHLLQKVRGDVTAFRSIFKDLEEFGPKNEKLGEKIRTAIHNIFLLSPEKTTETSPAQPAEPTAANPTSSTNPSERVAPLKRKDCEPSKGEEKARLSDDSIVPINSHVYEFKVHTTERFPKINLGTLHCASNLITAAYDKDDRQWAETLTGSEIALKDPKLNRFLALFRQVVSNALNESQLEQSLRSRVKPQGSEAAIDAMRNQLLGLCQRYSQSPDQITELYIKVSGDFAALEAHLKGEPVVFWEEDEDAVLMGPGDCPASQQLLAKKGLTKHASANSSSDLSPILN